MAAMRAGLAGNTRRLLRRGPLLCDRSFAILWCVWNLLTSFQLTRAEYLPSVTLAHHVCQLVQLNLGIFERL